MIRTVIKFYADWCKPCKMMTPIFEKVQTTKPNHIYKEVNIDHNAGLAAQYAVSSIPTIIVLENGRVIARKTGMMGLKDLENLIEGD